MLGATSQVHQDRVLAFSAKSNNEFANFAVRPAFVTQSLAGVGLGAIPPAPTLSLNP